MAYEVRSQLLPLAGGATTRAVELIDADAGQRVVIAPDLGGNVLSWQEPHRGAPIELLWQDFAHLTPASAIKQGIPLLFPFANRIRGGRFSWASQTYELPLNCPAQTHAIHGLLHARALPVHAQLAADNALALSLQTDLADVSGQLWPGALQLTVDIDLRPSVLSLGFTVANVSASGGEPAPFSLGLHPYWRLRPEAAVVYVHRSAEQVSYWELRDCLPTGGRLPARGKFARFLQQSPRAIGADRFDDVLHVAGPGPARWTIDSGQGWRLELEAGGGFRDYVIFTPPHRQALCLEPYTAVTDAINLYGRGIDAGLKLLAPGERWTGRVTARFIGE
jgi:aldose 1-epimerase